MNKVNAILELRLQLAYGHSLPIVTRKDIRECTKHSLYPLLKFMSFEKFLHSHRSFLLSLNIIQIPNTLYEALFDEK